MILLWDGTIAQGDTEHDRDLPTGAMAGRDGQRRFDTGMTARPIHQRTRFGSRSAPARKDRS
jgi:hypothetical protein